MGLHYFRNRANRLVLATSAPRGGTVNMDVAPKPLDVSHLEPYDISSQAPLWWGQVLLACIEGTMFCLLIAAYLYTRLRMDVWPPPGDQFPHLTLPTLALIPLIASAIGSYIASEGAKKNERGKMIFGL